MRKTQTPIFIRIVLSIFVFLASGQALSQDVNFNPGVSNSSAFRDATVQTMALQDDGKIFISGAFDSVGGVATSNIAKLDANGDIDPSFNAELSGVGYAMAIQSDGKLIVGGSIASAGGISGYVRNRIVRFNTDGSVDPDFDPDVRILSSSNQFFRAEVLTVLLQDDGKIIIGGRFDTVGGQARLNLARLNADGSVDASFPDLDVNGVVQSIKQQEDGQIVIAGNFTSVGGEVRGRVAGLNVADGSVDTSFIDPEVDGTVFAMAIQDNGGIIIGGSFVTIGGSDVRRVGRLNPNGSRDADFNSPNPPTLILTLDLQPDGEIIIGGRVFFLDGQRGGANSLYLARLLEDGSVQSDFNNPMFESSSFSNEITDVLIQDDGKILVAGSFVSIDSIRRNKIGRLNIDGSVERLSELSCAPIKTVNGAVAVVCL